MSTSATERSALPTAFAWLLVAIVVAAFGAVYEVFSHGVWSACMVYAFAYPLLLCALPACCLALCRRPLPSQWVLNLHGAGVATLTVGSVYEGVLVIYGTTHPMTLVYWVVGPALILAGLIVLLLQRKAA